MIESGLVEEGPSIGDNYKNVVLLEGRRLPHQAVG